MLMTGRAVSVICTLTIGGLVAALIYDSVGPNTGRTARLVGAAIGGLTVFSYWPVVIWSPLMRVDMLAIMLTAMGLWLAVRSSRRPWLLHLAVLSFVLAAYTKQTCVTAPIAVLIVSLMTDWRHALRAYALGLVAGLTALFVLTWSTDGGFLRHILLYNINTFSVAGAVRIARSQTQQFVFLLLALYGLAAGWKWLAGSPGWKAPAAFSRYLKHHAQARPIVMLTLYLILATLMLVTTGKSGASLNYLIEWMCIWSVLIGILVAAALEPVLTASARQRDAAGPANLGWFASLVPAVLAAQILIMPTARNPNGTDPAILAQLDALVAKIADARQPVLSKDMVLLQKAGKSVPWEPGIFAELANTGRWDERLITDMIAARAFAFIVTRGYPDTWTHDDPFTPAVDRAIQEAYPRTEELGGRLIHLPPA
jgi:hypothetical protein